ncbi:MAG: amino acid racemase [Prolixibacteraceae bacterium]
MQTIGILGGLGPEATVDYYKEIISGFNQLNTDGSLNYPEIVIYSVNMAKFIGLLEKEMYTEAADYIAASINKMKDAGAGFAAISANTPHLLFDEIQSKSRLPLISIVESCREAAVKAGVKRCGLLGTKFTMNNNFFGDVFAKKNIAVISPDPVQIAFIHRKLFSELEVGIFREDTKSDLLGIVEEMKNRDGIDSVILGCTEFPIMFTEAEYLGLPFLNTTRIHVKEIIQVCITD